MPSGDDGRWSTKSTCERVPKVGRDAVEGDADPSRRHDDAGSDTQDALADAPQTADAVVVDEDADGVHQVGGEHA